MKDNHYYATHQPNPLSIWYKNKPVIQKLISPEKKIIQSWKKIDNEEEKENPPRTKMPAKRATFSSPVRISKSEKDFLDKKLRPRNAEEEEQEVRKPKLVKIFFDSLKNATELPRIAAEIVCRASA